jgi:hypothetical protein
MATAKDKDAPVKKAEKPPVSDSRKYAAATDKPDESTVAQVEVTE